VGGPAPVRGATVAADAATGLGGLLRGSVWPGFGGGP